MAHASRRTVAVGAIALLAMAGCGEIRTAGDAAFAGQTYVATSVAQDGAARQVVPGSQLQLGFEDDRVTASAGCNTMSGTGGITGGVLVVSDLAMTEMACDPALMDQEQWWASLITGRPDAEVGDLALRLTSGSTVVTMVSQEAAPDLPLTGTGWQLAGTVAGETVASVPTGTASMLRIDGGTMTVTVADCRTTTVATTTAADELVFDPQAFAAATCAGEAGQLEAAVLAVYGSGRVGVAVRGDRLSVTGPDGSGLDYRG